MLLSKIIAKLRKNKRITTAEYCEKYILKHLSTADCFLKHTWLDIIDGCVTFSLLDGKVIAKTERVGSYAIDKTIREPFTGARWHQITGATKDKLLRRRG
jgi:hypothetical protein